MYKVEIDHGDSIEVQEITTGCALNIYTNETDSYESYFLSYKDAKQLIDYISDVIND